MNGKRLALFKPGSKDTLNFPAPPVDFMSDYNPTHIARVSRKEDIPDYRRIKGGKEPWIILKAPDQGKDWQDDSELLQACIDAGPHTIALIGRVDLAQQVFMRNRTVRLYAVRSEGVNSGPFSLRHPIRHDISKAAIVIQDGPGDRVIIDGAGVTGFNDKAGCFIQSETKRDIVMMDLALGNMMAYRDSKAAAKGTLYFVANNGGPLYDAKRWDGGRPWLQLQHQVAYSWIADSEIVVPPKNNPHKFPFISIHGKAALSMRGGKLGESVGPFIGAYDGATLDVLGTILNVAHGPAFEAPDDLQAIIIDEAAARIVALERYRDDNKGSFTHPVPVQETYRGKTKQLKRAATPTRQGASGKGFVLPIYVSGGKSRFR